MTDLHTHILPGLDDGSRSIEESLELLWMEQDQGVDTVALTPHFYGWQENAQSFLKRRAQALNRLRAALPPEAPSLLPGAEVAWFPTLADYAHLERLCFGDSGYFLLELPFEPWPARLLDRLYSLTCTTGLIPVLAHVERYSFQNRGQLEELLSMGLPMQMDADSLLDRKSRRRCMRWLKQGQWYLGSDCHSLDERPPVLKEAVWQIEKKLGPGRAGRLTGWTPEA